MKIIRYQTPTLAGVFSPSSRFGAFQNEVDRVLDHPFFGRESGNANDWIPALDLHQDKDNLYVDAEIPGVVKEDVTVSLNDGVLTLAGERRQLKSEGETNLRNERYFGHFERSITLPTQVDATRVNATYENGILTVTLPKAEAAKPRQIEINLK